MMKYFGCDSDEDKSNFLRVLLCYEKQEDICKETVVDQVNQLTMLFIKDVPCNSSSLICKGIVCI